MPSLSQENDKKEGRGGEGGRADMTATLGPPNNGDL